MYAASSPYSHNIEGQKVQNKTVNKGLEQKRTESLDNHVLNVVNTVDEFYTMGIITKLFRFTAEFTRLAELDGIKFLRYSLRSESHAQTHVRQVPRVTNTRISGRC